MVNWTMKSKVELSMGKPPICSRIKDGIVRQRMPQLSFYFVQNAHIKQWREIALRKNLQSNMIIINQFVCNKEGNFLQQWP